MLGVAASELVRFSELLLSMLSLEIAAPVKSSPSFCMRIDASEKAPQPLDQASQVKAVARREARVRRLAHRHTEGRSRDGLASECHLEKEIARCERQGANPRVSTATRQSDEHPQHMAGRVGVERATHHAQTVAMASA